MNREFIVYDVEIKRAILARGETSEPGILYCRGWDDYAGMGIACVCAYDSANRAFRVFSEDNRDAWLGLVEFARENAYVFVGYNNLGFDNHVLAGAGWANAPVTECYDLLREIWSAAGLGPRYAPVSHAGYGLSAVAYATFGEAKTGAGDQAPVAWQRRRWGSVIDYCLQDVRLTRDLFERAASDWPLVDPKTGRALLLRRMVGCHE